MHCKNITILNGEIDKVFYPVADIFLLNLNTTIDDSKQEIWLRWYYMENWNLTIFSFR